MVRVLILVNIFSGMILYLENTDGNNTKDIRTHFKHITKTYGKVKKLGMRHFQALRTAHNPSLDELQVLCDILVKASKR